MAKGYKTGGRQKGTPNKITVKIREKLAEFCAQSLQIALDQPQKISANDRMLLMTKLLPFLLPKEKPEYRHEIKIDSLEYNHLGNPIGLKIKNTGLEDKEEPPFDFGPGPEEDGPEEPPFDFN